MVHRVEPFRRYLWTKGRLSEPSWLGSWVESSEHHCLWKKIGFFLRLLFLSFFSSLPHHGFSCFCHVHCPSCPARHTPPSHTLLHTHLAPILPYTSLPPVPFAPIPNPFKILSFYAWIVFSFLLLGAPRTCLVPPEGLLAPFDVEQVHPRPPNPPTMHVLVALKY